MLILHRCIAFVAAIAAGAAMLAGCGGGGAPLSPVQQALAQAADPGTTARATDGGGGISGRMVAAPDLPGVATLIAAGAEATPDIVTELGRAPAMARDDVVVACAYVLSRTQDRRAVRALMDYLSAALTGDALWSLDAATYALKTLTEQDDAHAALPVYAPEEILDTIARAEAWLAVHPDVAAQQLAGARRAATVGTATGYVRIYLTDAAGDPFYYGDPRKGSALSRVQFDLRIFRDPGVPSPTLMQVVPYGGGTFIAGQEGSEALMGRIGICGGYALREMLRFGGNTTPQGGWHLDPALVFVALTESGILTRQPDRALAQAGDIVFWKKDGRATHGAIIQDVVPATVFGSPTISVRNKDETSGVFTADIDATYYNMTGMFSRYQKQFGTPEVYTYTGGAKPMMMVDTTLSDLRTPVGDKLYLQNVVVVVK